MVPDHTEIGTHGSFVKSAPFRAEKEAEAASNDKRAADQEEF
jgi:hypothetical protein